MVKEKKKCIKYNTQNILNDILKIEKFEKKEKNETETNKEEEKTKEEIEKEEIQYYDTILKIIDEAFSNENYDTTNLDSGEDEVIETEKMTVTFTTTQNQKNSVNNNMTTIDLGDCEISLRNFYNISKNETLYMKKLDISQEGMKTKKVEYDVYCKLSGNNLEKLNLSVCENNKISLSVPLVITESLDKLNASSGYYNDLCYTTTSESGTDILLKDRKKEFVQGNKTVCQDDCDFAEYDYSTQKAKCSCKVKESSTSIADMKINKTKLFDNLKDFKNIANFNILVCCKNLFNTNGIIKNVGCLLILSIIILHIIFIILFYAKHLGKLKKKIKDIIFAIKNYRLIKKAEKKIKEENSKNKNDINEINNPEIDSKRDLVNFNGKRKKKKKKKKGKKKKGSKTTIFNNNFIHNIDIGNNNYNKITTNIIPENDEKENKKDINIKKRNKIERVKNIMKYHDDEINVMSYDLALQYDNKTYCEYYVSLLKTKHNLIFSFFNNNDYNSIIIKIDLFFIGFTIYYTVNALFYNDDTMHKIYESKGSFDLEYQLPIILYSSIISMILNTLLKILA